MDYELLTATGTMLLAIVGLGGLLLGQFRRIDRRFGQLETKFEGMFADLGVRMERLELRMDRVEVRMERLEARMDQLEARIDQLEARMDQLEGRMDRLEGRMDRLDVMFGGGSLAAQ